MVRKFIKSIFAGCIIALLPAAVCGAITYGSGTYGDCTYTQCGITLSADSAVNLNVTPTSGGRCTIDSSTVGVSTGSGTGFTLTATTATTNNSMVTAGETHSIAASDGTTSSPKTLHNSWGFRVNGLDNFGSGGPTGPVSNGAPDSTTFAGFPTSNQTAAVLAQTTDYNATTVNTVVWYGLCADTTIPSGDYSATVVFTAVTN